MFEGIIHRCNISGHSALSYPKLHIWFKWNPTKQWSALFMSASVKGTSCWRLCTKMLCLTPSAHLSIVIEWQAQFSGLYSLIPWKWSPSYHAHIDIEQRCSVPVRSRSLSIKEWTYWFAINPPPPSNMRLAVVCQRETQHDSAVWRRRALRWAWALRLSCLPLKDVISSSV